MRKGETKRAKNEVLRQACDIFRKYGYSGATVSQISNVTGMFPGSLYSQYGSKLGLYKACFEWYVAQRLSALQKVLSKFDEYLDAGAGALHIEYHELTREAPCLVERFVFDWVHSPEMLVWAFKASKAYREHAFNAFPICEEHAPYLSAALEKEGAK